ncbi:MAG: ABC transporter substrate-binding protein [Pseudomonadota bacterium]
MFRLTVFFAALALTACGGKAPVSASSDERPMRIVSLDFCADNYVLKLADREQILAISPDAEKDFTYMRDAATGIPTVRAIAEDVLILKPDLVVRSYGGGPNAAAFLERAGIPVLQVGWASTIAGEEVGSVSHLVQNMADGLGQSARGKALVADFRKRLDALERRAPGSVALYMSAAGVTSGPGSMAHEMLSAAGLSNFQDGPGWRSLPLERLAYQQPDVVAASFFNTSAPSRDAWSAARHPVARAQLNGPDVVFLDGAWTACGGWYVLDAVEALANGGVE